MSNSGVRTLPEPVASSPLDGAGDQSAVSSAESAVKDGTGQASGTPSAASAAMESTATRAAKKRLATYNRGREDE